MTTWRSLGRNRSKIRQMFAIWIHERFAEQAKLRLEDQIKLDNGEITLEQYEDLIQKDHADAFTLREIMETHGLDYDARSDYTKAYSALAEERKSIEAYFEMFLQSGAFDEAKKEGKSDDAIWGDFIGAANSWNIHLLYSDADSRYKQIDLFSYASLINRRILAMDSELRTKADQLRIVGKALPQLLPHLKPPELDGFQDRHRMLVSHAWSCPFCPNTDFSDEDACKKHLQDVHKANSIGDSGDDAHLESASPMQARENQESTLLRCPFCKKGGLRLLQYGDFKCTECEGIITKDEFKNFFQDS